MRTIIKDEIAVFILDHYRELTPAEIGNRIHVKEDTVRMYMIRHNIPQRRLNGTLSKNVNKIRPDIRQGYFNPDLQPF